MWASVRTGIDTDQTAKEEWKKKQTSHLCKLQRAESNFVKKLGFDPVFIHPSDDCEDISLHARKKLIDTVNFEKIVKKRKKKKKKKQRNSRGNKVVGWSRQSRFGLKTEHLCLSPVCPPCPPPSLLHSPHPPFVSSGLFLSAASL